MIANRIVKKIPDRSFFIALIGVVVEHYEYTLFGFSAAIIAINFFPEHNQVSALLHTFGLFSIGYFAKLFGALFFGHIGDKYGRVQALRISMVGIAVPTTLISILPTYSQWGFASLIVLLICRLLQGLFIAGEHDGVSIYILEKVSSRRACFANSLVGLCYNIGIYFAAFSVALTQLPDLPDWTWRLPFLLGGFLGFISLYSRQFLSESPEFKKYLLNRKSEISLISILKKSKKKFFMSIALFGSIGSIYHFYIIFWHTYLYKVINVIELGQATFFTSMLILLHMIMKPMVGYIGDKFGVNRLLKLGILMMLLTNIFNMYQLHIEHIYYASLIIISFSLSLFTVTGYVYLIKLFQPHERYRVLSLAHALSSCLFSGTIPLICTWLWQATNTSIIPLIYLSVFPLIIYWVVVQKV